MLLIYYKQDCLVVEILDEVCFFHPLSFKEGTSNTISVLNLNYFEPFVKAALDKFADAYG